MIQHIKLKEIIWEITDNCGQNCSYCGSKDSINKTGIDAGHIRTIINRIAAFPPEQIDISGGNPLLVSHMLHNYLCERLHEKNVVCKILVNPFNISNAHPSCMDGLWTNLYDWIGLSVNNMSEFEELPQSLQLLRKCTIITNFNTSNIFMFKTIEKFVIENKLTWQVQLTMYKGKNDLAIYQNAEAYAYFKQLVQDSAASLVLADNANRGTCTAGMKSLGIFANGCVVPCLSMRSWCEDSEMVSMGNLGIDTLEEVWVKGFSRHRCKPFKCCKDITKCCEDPIVEEEVKECLNINDWLKTDAPIPQYPYAPFRPMTDIICTYAVIANPVQPLPRIDQTYVYGVVRSEDMFSRTAWDGSIITNNTNDSERS